MYAVGDTHSHMSPVGDGGGRGGALPCTQWGMLSDTCPQWGMGEERRISAMYPVGDAQ